MTDHVPTCITCGKEFEYIGYCDECHDNEAKQADKDQQAINNYEDEMGDA